MNRKTCKQQIAATGAGLLLLCALTVMATGSASAGEFQKKEIRFAVPPWPGVIVKTAVVSRVLDILGYDTDQEKLSNVLAFQSVSNKDIDAYLEYWSPNMDNLAEKYIADGAIEVVGNNVPNGSWGIAVPDYVWQSGVKKISDLDKNRDKFGGVIYGIESGAVMNQKIKAGIDDNAGGLGDWELKPSSTAMMLASVERSENHHEWIAWGAWEPHWMMAEYHGKFLKNDTDSDLRNDVTIKTVVAPGFAEAHPNVYQFLKNFKINAKTQEEWTRAYKAQKEISDRQQADRWLAGHLDVVSQWLDGVHTRNGGDAEQALQDHYQ